MGIPDRDDANKIVGRSKLSRYDKDPATRHALRRRAALRLEKKLKSWLIEVGIDLQIKNRGHHWQMRGDQFYADWWPSSAKFVIDKKFSNGIHVHGVDQIASLIADRLKIPRPDFAVQRKE